MKRLIFAAAALFVALTAFGQQAMPLPIDPAVRIGHLDNGLTYYIRHNEEPKGQANFYIAQKVGSILENEDQRGLAHFLEHMCFNGMDKFPGNGVITYCESIGVKFGNDLNAYTSFDETVYNIDNVPVGKVPSSVDSCLWILHGWADGLLLTDADIDNERGVIHEEWRSRSNAQMRQFEKSLPVLLPGNLYGERLPIGKMEVVDNFPYQVLRDYYHKWYRPDQQGIIVVGDIDVDEVEGKIKAIFGDMKMPENPAERFYVPVEDNAEPLIAVTTDKEQPYALSMIYCKHDDIPTAMKGDMQYYVYSTAIQLANIMMSQRLLEFSQLPQPPFIQAAIYDMDYAEIARTKKSLTGIAVTSGDGVLKGIETVYREMLRAARNGFTDSEYERAKAEFLTHMESAYNSREKKKSAQYCREYVSNFTENEPIMGIENSYAIAQQILPAIPVAAINQIYASLMGDGHSNRAVCCLLPEQEGVAVPDQQAIKDLLASIEAEDIPAYEDKVSDEPLIAQLPTPGKVVKTAIANFGYKKYVLSNGVTVYFKPSDLNKDEILMKAFSFGGFAKYTDDDPATLKAVDDLLSIGGLGNFNVTELNKALSGKKANVYANVEIGTESVSGSTTPKDFETMMQLIYLNFTGIRQDDEAYTSYYNRTKAALINAESNPITVFKDTVNLDIYVDDTFVSRFTAADLEKVNYARALEIARERFANAADFVFVFTGNVVEDVAVPMFEQYLGSLPAGGKKEQFPKQYPAFKKGAHANTFDRPMEVPMTTNFFAYEGNLKYNLKNNICFSIANQALSTVLLEEIREKEGGTYGIGAFGITNCMPKQIAFTQIVYQTNPDRAEYLNSRVEQIVADFAANGPSEENLNKVKEYLSKNYQKNLRENRFWLNSMVEMLKTGVDEYTTYESVLNSITVKDIRDVFAAIAKQGNIYKVVMNGVPAKAPEAAPAETK